LKVEHNQRGKPLLNTLKNRAHWNFSLADKQTYLLGLVVQILIPFENGINDCKNLHLIPALVRLNLKYGLSLRQETLE
jgi:hypothetical protein